MHAMAPSRGMVTPTSWDALNPYNLLGVKPAELVSPSDRSPAPLTSATGNALDRNGAKPWHPDNPLFWFGALAAVTFGFIGASTAVRLGPFKAAVKAGQT